MKYALYAVGLWAAYSVARLFQRSDTYPAVSSGHLALVVFSATLYLMYLIINQLTRGSK
jgi:hypothetical protein